MKVKTSITLSKELLQMIDQQSILYKKNRSHFIEAAVWAFVVQQTRNKQNARDIEIMNQRAETLNKEASDVLAYQVKQ